MRLSLNWLTDFVELAVAPEVLADRLTMAGLEIDAIERITPGFSGVVVGQVTTVEPHPQADRLRLAEVTTGSQTYRVVCGAPNLELGRLYPFAPIGAAVSAARRSRPPSFGASPPKGCSVRKTNWGCPRTTWA